MSRRNCADCTKLRAAVADWSSCKKTRLCAQVDPALVLRYPGEKLPSYRDRARAIEIGYAKALQHFKTNDMFPHTGSELLGVCVDAHQRVFGQGDALIAGKIRDQRVWFGRHGHEREGAEPHLICTLVSQMKLTYPPTTVAVAAQWGASFLQRFFAIHPFADGNGRVARLLLTWAIEESRDLYLTEDWLRGSDDKEYERALEFAHANVQNAERSLHLFTDHLRLLRLWLEKRIEVIVVDDDSAEITLPE